MLSTYFPFAFKIGYYPFGSFMSLPSCLIMDLWQRLLPANHGPDNYQENSALFFGRKKIKQ